MYTAKKNFQKKEEALGLKRTSAKFIDIVFTCQYSLPSQLYAGDAMKDNLNIILNIIYNFLLW